MPYPEELPVDTIWEAIAYLLDSPNDLLSLALACRDFKELIIPDHLEYRRIRCDLARENVWTFLASQPRLARGIRSVELIDERGSKPDAVRTPQSLGNISFDRTRLFELLSDENMAMFIKSLSNMVFLKTFVWKHTYAPLERILDIFYVLRNKTRSLEALSVDFNTMWRHELQLNDASIWAVTGLTKLVIRKPIIAAIQMINLCPGIEDLSLWDTIGASIAYLMQYVTLKNLQRLSLIADEYYNAPDISPTMIPHLVLISNPSYDTPDILTTMISFFSRHANLECLALNLFKIPIPTLPSSCLPKLRSIGGTLNGSIFKSSPFLPDNVISRLVHWYCPIQLVYIDALPQMDNLVSCNVGFFFKNRLPSTLLPPFLLRAPNLERIDLNTEYWDVSFEKKIEEHELLIEALSRCPKLTHAFCDFDLHRADPANDFHESLEHFAQRLSAWRNLKFLRVLLGKERRFIELQRDQDGQYSQYRFVTLEEVGGNSECWGNLFFRL